MSLFTGCATALITPFTKDGVDFAALTKLLEFQIADGIDALVVCGTTGEPATMTKVEKTEVIKHSIKIVDGRVPVIVGTGGNNTAEVINWSKEVEAMGADALLVVTPYYNKCTQDGLIAHYNAVADAVNIPIICYNVPGRTGVNIQPSTFAKIAEHKNIVGIKEACGNMEQISETARLCRGKADVYSGDDGITVPILSIGGKGVISVASNVAPSYMHNLTEAFFKGDTNKAAEMQLDILPLIKALFSEVNPIPVKKAAELKGFCQKYIRLPLTEMTVENTAKLTAVMKNLNIL